MKIQISRGGENFGPYSLQEIDGHLKSGALSVDDLASVEGTNGWRPLRDVLTIGNVASKDGPIEMPGATAPPPLPTTEFDSKAPRLGPLNAVLLPTPACQTPHPPITTLEFLRYWLAAYVFAVVPLAVTLLFGAGARLLGVDTNYRNRLFGMILVIGFVCGMISGGFLMSKITPTKGKDVDRLRLGEIGAGSILFLIVQFVCGWLITRPLLPELSSSRGFTQDATAIIWFAVTGGVVSSLCTTIYMAYKDRKASLLA